MPEGERKVARDEDVMEHRRMKRALFMMGLVVTMASMANAQSPALVLKDLANQEYEPLKGTDEKPALVVFVSPYCPTSNKLMPEVNAIIKDHEGRINAFLVHADAGVKREDVQQHLELYQVKATVLLDEQQLLMKQLQATTTPEVVLISKGGAVVYQGRIDDWYLTPTKRQRQPTVHDLRKALEEVLAGKPVTVAKTEAMGCKITAKP